MVVVLEWLEIRPQLEGSAWESKSLRAQTVVSSVLTWAARVSLLV